MTLIAFAITVAAAVQLVRIPACHAGGRGFEPRPLRQLPKYIAYSPEWAFRFVAFGLDKGSVSTPP